MRDYTRERERLREATLAVESRFARFGVNKKREIVRLLYEIAKRERVRPKDILDGIEPTSFGHLKGCLLERRFPRASALQGRPRPRLPALRLDASSVVTPGDGRFSPRRIIAETAVRDSRLVRTLRRLFPEADFSEIPSLSGYVKSRNGFSTADYNRRCESVFIVEAVHDLFKRCPCTRGAVPCGYHIFNLGFGCIFNCTYCYLQDYANSPGIVLPASLDAFFDGFGAYARTLRRPRRGGGRPMRMGSGEFADSLMLDDITGHSLPIIEFFGGRRGVLFEFKTKSSNVGNLLRARHAGNIVIAWSLNPRRIIDENEFHTAALEERLQAAERCREAGYRLAFHFDPVLHFEGWEREYRLLVEELFSRIPPGSIAWISVGSLRFAPAVKQVIEARFPANTILDAELLPGYDGKLRYPRPLRYKIYETMVRLIRMHHCDSALYLCMEDRAMWDALGLEPPFK